MQIKISYLLLDETTRINRYSFITLSFFIDTIKTSPRHADLIRSIPQSNTGCRVVRVAWVSIETGDRRIIKGTPPVGPCSHLQPCHLQASHHATTRNWSSVAMPRRESNSTSTDRMGCSSRPWNTVVSRCRRRQFKLLVLERHLFPDCLVRTDPSPCTGSEVVCVVSRPSRGQSQTLGLAKDPNVPGLGAPKARVAAGIFILFSTFFSPLLHFGFFFIFFLPSSPEISHNNQRPCLSYYRSPMPLRLYWSDMSHLMARLHHNHPHHHRQPCPPVDPSSPSRSQRPSTRPSPWLPVSGPDYPGPVQRL